MSKGLQVRKLCNLAFDRKNGIQAPPFSDSGGRLYIQVCAIIIT